MSFHMNYKRRSRRRSLIKTFLIVCEGSKTEPGYIEDFPINRDKYHLQIEGLGYNSLSLVEAALEFVRKAESAGLSYAQVWCVFDKDECSKHNFNSAIELARKNDIRCAYSNESFELWYILHFRDNHAALTRHDYEAELKRLLKNDGGYSKNRSGMYRLLLPKQKMALRYANRLCKKYSEKIPPAGRNPYTNISELVDELNKLA